MPPAITLHMQEDDILIRFGDSLSMEIRRAVSSRQRLCYLSVDSISLRRLEFLIALDRSFTAKRVGVKIVSVTYMPSWLTQPTIGVDQMVYVVLITRPCFVARN
ncbi:hypothetical protein CHS0354_007208 [Potamilus streckersoni]|uniref:Uncharacterized protein n=1 Tax=Potamilus streckersoni TaxID=2493646 RepID=A0AAE0WDN6_9BIVA|nr:hypothetical protein CHS0354_007208 [Potamilus streckersoni]